MSSIPVDVNATFNTQGKIKPLYVRLEDSEHTLHTYKIESIEFYREEKFAGTTALLFGCYILVHDRLKMIKIRYNPNVHQWILIQ